jgi:GT2 family glycosyltransferase
VALAPDAMGTLTAPVAVRVLDLDTPLGDVDLSYQYVRHDYRSLLAVVRLAEDPIGVATFPVDAGGCVTRAQLTGGLHQQLGAELDEAYARRGRECKPDAGWDTSDLAAVTEVPPYPSVSVVVPTRGNLDMLERSLRSVLLCDYDDFEVIVVETKPHSSDTPRMLVREFPGERRVRYMEEPRSSTSHARNVAVARAEGEIVAFADEDMVVDPLWLRASVEALVSERSIACVTGLILPLDLESKRQVLLEQSAGFKKGFRRRTYRLPDAWAENPLLPYAAGALGSGASIVMPTELARELGGFDPALGPATPAGGGEDIDLLVRLLRKGHAVSYEPRAIVWRERPGGAVGLRRQAYRHGVGLGAMLGKQLLARPERRDFLRAIPAGLCYLRAPGSRKEMGRRTSIPRHLSWLESIGMLVGPLAYLVSALAVRAGRRAAKRAPSPRPLRIVRRMVVAGERVNIVWFRDVEAPGGRFTWRPATEQRRPSLIELARRRAGEHPQRVAKAAVAVAPLAAVALWIFSLPNIHPRAMTDLGLISVLPFTFLLALAILTVSFVGLIHRRILRTWALAGHVLALVAFVHATPTLVYGTLRYSWAWKHVGIVDYISRHGGVDPAIRFQSVYHNWPGFFGVDTLLIKLAGLPDTLAIATWGPVFNNVLFFGALLFLFSGLTRDRRVVWLACWLFFIADWVGQDYFSPQAFALLLYMVLLGVVVRWLRRRSQAEPPGRAPALGLAVLLLATIAPSHALTSVMACIALTALVLTRVSDARGLPIVAIALTVFWDLVFAWDFAGRDLSSTVRQVKLPWDTTSSSLTNVGRLSADQALVANVARGFSFLIVLIAAAGAFRQLRAGKVSRPAVVLAVAPVVLFATGNYDGEILFRIYLFAVPFLAFLGAHAFIGHRRSWVSVVATTLATTLILGVFLVAYYGKERSNYFTPQEVAAARYMDTHAPSDSLLIDATNNYPFSFKNYERFVYVPIAEEPTASRDRVLADPATVLSNWANSGTYRAAYVIITRSQKIDVEANGTLPPGSVDAIQNALLASSRFRVVFRNRDATVFSGLISRAGSVVR